MAKTVYINVLNNFHFSVSIKLYISFYSKYRFLYQMYTLNKQVIIIKGRAIKHAVTKSVWKIYMLIVPGSQAESAPQYTPFWDE